jgi:hypothetical protein
MSPSLRSVRFRRSPASFGVGWKRLECGLIPSLAAQIIADLVLFDPEAIARREEEFNS